MLVQRSYASVALLVEMLADDHAARQRPARELVTALIRVGSAGTPGTPAGTLAMADDDAALADSGVTARVERLLMPTPGISLPARVLVCGAAAALVVVPAALLVMPLYGSWVAARRAAARRPASSWGVVADLDAHPAEPLALVLDLDNGDPANLAGRGHVRAPVRLLVEADDIDDPHLLDLGRDQVVAVRMMSGMAKACPRGRTRTSIRRSAASSALHAASTASRRPGGPREG